MKGKELGELEELVLLVIGVLYEDAYGLNIRQEIIDQTGRKATIGAVHSTLNRLEEKGLLNSETSAGTNERGGRRKRIFSITNAGIRAIEKSKEQRNSLYNQIPNLVWKSLEYGKI